jgi:hypothetical protein
LSEPGDDEYSSQIYFRFGDTYSPSFIKAEDHIQLQTEHNRAPILWSLAKYENRNENNVLFVNSLPYGEQKVALGVNAPLAGEYVFSFKEFANETIESVVLWDRVTNVETELLVNEYHFQSDGNTNTDDRFVVFFNRSTTSVGPVTAPEVYVYVENNLLTVKNLLAGDAIRIVDLTGRTLFSDVATGDTFSVALNQKGVYIVKIQGDKTFKVLNK